MIARDGDLLRVEGAITLATVTALCEEGRRHIAAGGTLVADLAGATDIDSSALSLLFEWQREARRRGGALSFRNLPPSLQSLAGLYGVSELLAAGG